MDILVAWDGDEPAGIVHTRGTRLGPVAAFVPGAGLGRRLTLAALARMHARGATRATFMIATADVEGFYARLGFTVLRRFERLRRS